MCVALSVLKIGWAKIYIVTALKRDDIKKATVGGNSTVQLFSARLLLSLL